MVSGRLLRILLSRIGLVLAILLVTVGATAAGSMLTPKRYVASTVMLIDIPSKDPVLGGSVYLQGTIRGYLASQVELIESQRVAKRVIDDLGLTQDPLLIRQWAQTTEGTGELEEWIRARLASGLTVEPEREAAVIKLYYEDIDPELAARIANGFAAAYVNATLDLTTEPARNYAQLFETQVDDYRARLSAARQRLWEYQQRTGIVTGEERNDIVSTRLQELSSQLVRLEAEALASASRLDALRDSSRDTMPEIVGNAMLASIRTEIARAQGRLEEQSASLGDRHPQTLAIRSELQALRQRYAAELGRVRASIAAAAALDQQRVELTRVALERQKAEVLEMKQQRDQLAALQREVDEAQQGLELMTQRSTQTDLEARMRLSNVSILSGASIPSSPSRPKPLLNIVVGSALGLMLGMLAAITLEKVQRPIRDADDLMQVSGVPILAVLSHADSRRPQRLIGRTGPHVAALPPVGAD
ncbi:MAG: chain length determinant protein EpsF [Limnobacter sp.]|nr:chain length determinant protein EpsF [Limnobacter sp.]